MILIFHEDMDEALSSTPYWPKQSYRNPQGIVLAGSVCTVLKNSRGTRGLCLYPRNVKIVSSVMILFLSRSPVSFGHLWGLEYSRLLFQRLFYR